MDELRRLAEISVGRACGFAGLGIFSVMVGLAFDPYLSVKSGAILASILAAVLMYRASRAGEVPYRRTEVWLMLDRDDAPPEAYAQSVISAILRETYMRFATVAAIAAGVMWVLTGLLGWLV